MTVGMLIDRLERFRQGVGMYREICKGDVLHSHNGCGVIDSSGVEMLRDKLRQQFSVLDEYVTDFTQGRYHIHLDSSDFEDMYVQAFSEDCREWHLDHVLRDLEHILAELRQRPLHQPVVLHNQWKVSGETNGQRSFGSLGHQGYCAPSNKTETLHGMLSTVAHILHQRIDRPEDHEKLQTHLQAIVDHPEMAALLSLPPSKLL